MPRNSEGEYRSRPTSHYPTHEPNTYDDFRDDDEEEDESIYKPGPLPEHGLIYAIGLGILTGIICTLLPVVIALINAPLYRQAASEGEKMSYNLAQTVTGLACLGILLELTLCFGLGILLGRIAVKRWYGFISGALAGAVAYLGGLIPPLFPDFPTVVKGTARATTINGILGSFVVLTLIYAIVGGLIGLWGTWFATRKHPYYLYKREQAV